MEVSELMLMSIEGVDEGDPLLFEEVE